MKSTFGLSKGNGVVNAQASMDPVSKVAEKHPLCFSNQFWSGNFLSTDDDSVDHEVIFPNSKVATMILSVSCLTHYDCTYERLRWVEHHFVEHRTN